MPVVVTDFRQAKIHLDNTGQSHMHRGRDYNAAVLYAGAIMKSLTLYLLLFANTACYADAYMCTDGNRKVVQATPCDAHAPGNKIVTDTKPSAAHGTAAFQQQVQNIQRTRAGTTANYAPPPVPQPPPMSLQQRTARCEGIPWEIKNIEARVKVAGTYSTVDMLRDQIRQLESEHSRLGC
ncbi:MAG: hypothetical protein H6R10_601 [Rhodocyclaceae bacterium]|nr:hypothetical protein [Rhodocyclaceae bacterium]